ncbi:hypothetical protein BC793_1437 [Actinoplanes xinjiangensis]|uniref:Uncharacterized protein n=1 Tax=Actinoplanes xinjiangensis TaxID=512350 RepID=A0A316EF27_9ACTN|nr:hypothetical protein BC793_1437 [Actinoplanes xinjiangensis]
MGHKVADVGMPSLYVADMNRSKRLIRRRFVDYLRVCTCAC